MAAVSGGNDSACDSAFHCGALREALTGVSTTSDASPLLRALEVEGVSDLLANATDACGVAQLAACCHTMRNIFRDSSLWTELLKRRFGDALGTGVKDPFSLYARYELLERWELAPANSPSSHSPGTPFSPLAGSKAKTSVTQLYSAGRENLQPNSQPHTPATLVQGKRKVPMQAKGSSSSSRNSGSGVGRCMRTRLKQDLFDIMMAGGNHVSAFPEEPDDLSLWRATINCPLDGSVYAGVHFVLRLQFQLDVDDAIGTLPHVQLLQPACFHPNVNADGVLCAEVLHRRCSPLARVCEVLAEISKVLRCPCFAVKPLNGEAAALWYGDQSFLRKLAAPSIGATPKRPTPLSLTLPSTAEKEGRGHTSQPRRRIPLGSLMVSQGAAPLLG